ncbi:MAG: hypothetical protein NDJ94_03935 [Vicinamibacteria bacterium]|nr:hypothetical protein [Vicinamibacteria bacterium]
MNAPRAALALVLAASPAFAVQPQLHRFEGASDFLAGELENLAVDSLGRLRLAGRTTLAHDPGTPYAWSVARDGKGTVYLGTGNEGKVLAIGPDGTAKELFDAPELEVHALALGPDDRLYAATSPDGKVYAIDRKGGKALTFYDPADKYIWGLAFDGQGQLYVATGAEAKLHRVNAKGEGVIVLTTAETHFTALAVDKRGHAFVGSAPGGIVYEVDPKGVGRVVADTGYKEVKALVPTATGAVYAAVVDGRDAASDRTRPVTPPPAPAATPSPAPAGETLAQPPGFEGVAVVVTASAAAPAPPRGPQKGAVLRLAPEGDVDVLWTSIEETPLALAPSERGVTFGTGAARGKVYEVRDDRTWTLLASFAAQQVTGLAGAPGGGLLAAVSNPGQAWRIEAAPAASGSFTSKVKDTETPSTWGQVSWTATLPRETRVEVQTRTGNTGTPDSTWSAWSEALTAATGAAVKSPRGRFVQVRVVLHGAGATTPVLDGLQLAYLQRNLRPAVSAVTAHPPGEVFGRPMMVSNETEVLGLVPGTGPDLRRPGTRPPTLNLGMSRRLYVRGLQAFTWRAEDANGDELRYDLHYRAVGDERYRPIQRGLDDAVFTWDTSTVPNGRYVLRVTASDAAANPAELAQSGERESVAFDVDNTPPTVSARLEGRFVKARAADADTAIRKVEWALDGSPWQEVHPEDGLSDSADEAFSLPVPAGEGAGPHVLVLRATDRLGNVGTARVEIP